MSYNIDLATYTKTEKAVGTWIDGKTIYRKTVDFGTLPSNNSKSVNHNISNLNYVVKIEGISKRSTDGVFFSIGNVPNPSAGISAAISVTADNSKIVIQTGIDRTDMSAFVTLYYTKNS